MMVTKANFVLKIQNATLADVQNVLKDAGISIVSIIEIHRVES